MVSKLILRKILFALLVFLFAAPAILGLFPGKKTAGGLEGFTEDEKIQRPGSPSSQAWLSGKFQAEFGDWFSKNMGLRPFYIRLHNQLHYDLFRSTDMYKDYLVIGKKGWLFESTYLLDHFQLARGPLPLERLRKTAKEMVRLQTILEKRGVLLVVLITPSKAFFYPEFVPDDFKARRAWGAPNYEKFIHWAQEYGIHCVDGHKITQEFQKTEKSPIFPRGGAHWNYRCALKSADALTREINSHGFHVPEIKLNAIQTGEMPGGTDRDIARLLNLFREVDFDPDLKHPVFGPGDIRGASADKIVFIGGSFLEGIIHLYNQNFIFREMDYFKYYDTVQVCRNGNCYEEPKEDKITGSKAERIFHSGAKILVLEINEANFKGRHYTKFLSEALNYFDGSPR